MMYGPVRASTAFWYARSVSVVNNVFVSAGLTACVLVYGQKPFVKVRDEP